MTDNIVPAGGRPAPQLMPSRRLLEAAATLLGRGDDENAFGLIYDAARRLDLAGLTGWWSNGPYLGGTIAEVIPAAQPGDERVRFAGCDHTESLLDLLSAGWLQEPGTPYDRDDEDLSRTIRTLRSRLEAPA
jgi:hypothetical protein